MSHYLIAIGIMIIGYTLVAYFFGFPQFTDFLPIGLFDNKVDEEFYKIVPSDNLDKSPWLIIGLGAVLILVGLTIKYVLQK